MLFVNLQYITLLMTQICYTHVKHAWLCANQLSLNTAKTEFIIFMPPRSNCENRITLSLNSAKLYESTKIRYLRGAT